MYDEAVSTAELIVSEFSTATAVAVSTTELTTLVSTDEAADVAVSTTAVAVSLELTNPLIIDEAVLLMAETFTLTETEALAAELEDEELSSSVAVDE